MMENVHHSILDFLEWFDKYMYSYTLVLYVHALFLNPHFCQIPLLQHHLWFVEWFESILNRAFHSGENFRVMGAEMISLSDIHDTMLADNQSICGYQT